MEFCDLCGTMMILNTESTKELSNICLNCNNVQAVKRSNKIYEENFVKVRNKDILIRYACDMITVPRSMEYCPSCKKEELVSIIRREKTLKEMYICCKCKKYWE